MDVSDSRWVFLIDLPSFWCIVCRCCHIMTPRTSSLASLKTGENTQGHFPLAIRHARLIQRKEQIIRFFSTLEGNHHFKTNVVQHLEKDCLHRQGLDSTKLGASFCSDSNWFQSLEFERKFDG